MKHQKDAVDNNKIRGEGSDEDDEEVNKSSGYSVFKVTVLNCLWLCKKTLSDEAQRKD